MEEALKYFENLGIPIKNGLIDSENLTSEHIQLLKEWEAKTTINGIMMPHLEDFYRSLLVAISLNPQKNEDGTIRYLFGKGIGIEIALRGKIQGRRAIETDPIYRSHSDFELYDAKEEPYTPYFLEIFHAQEYYPPTETKGLKDIPEGEMDSTYEIVDLDGYKILVPRLELLFLDKFLKKESTPRDGKYDCELLAGRYDLDPESIYEYLKKYFFEYRAKEQRKDEKQIKDCLSTGLIRNLNSVIRGNNGMMKQGIKALNGSIDFCKQKFLDAGHNGIRAKTYTPLTLQDVIIDENGGYSLTQEYMDRAMQNVSAVINSEIATEQNKTISEINIILERTGSVKINATQSSISTSTIISDSQSGNDIELPF